MRTCAAASSRWICSGHISEQALARRHARERDRLHRYAEIRADAGERGMLQRPGLGEVGTEMRAARIAPRACRGGDRAADRDQALQVHLVVPREVEGTIIVGDAVRIELGFERGELERGFLKAPGVAEDADLFP